MSNRRKAKRPELVDPWVADELAADVWIEAWENEAADSDEPARFVNVGYITTDGLNLDSPPPLRRMIEKPEDYRLPESWSFSIPMEEHFLRPILGESEQQ